MEYTKPETWDNWFLTVKNRHNGVTFPMEITTLEDTHFTTNKEHWKIYLTVHMDNGMVFKTSSLVKYDKENGSVITESGSTYKLDEPLNEFQLPNLNNYFTENTYISLI
jgi:hypothetical protein